jgi:hypothetical protein
MIQPTCSWPQKHRNGSLGLPRAPIADSRSPRRASPLALPAVTASAPGRPECPGASLPKIEVPANARDQHDCVVRTQPRRAAGGGDATELCALAGRVDHGPVQGSGCEELKADPKVLLPRDCASLLKRSAIAAGRPSLMTMSAR